MPIENFYEIFVIFFFTTYLLKVYQLNQQPVRIWSVLYCRSLEVLPPSFHQKHTGQLKRHIDTETSFILDLLQNSVLSVEPSILYILCNLCNGVLVSYATVLTVRKCIQSNAGISWYLSFDNTTKHIRLNVILWCQI